MTPAFPYENFPSAVTAARQARKRGDNDAAADIYRQLPVIYPEKKNAPSVASDGLKDCGFLTEAIAVLEAAIRKAPRSALYLSSLAEIYRSLGDPERAATYLQRYLDHDPRSPEAWLSLARLRDLSHDYDGAEKAYASALERDPRNTLAAIGRGDAYFQLGRTEEAIVSYRRAIAMEPQNVVALFALGSILMSQGSQSEGHSYIKKSLELDPTNARAHVNLGLIYFNTGNVDEAVAAARNALAIDDKLQIAQVLLGMALAELGDLDGAAVSLSNAVAAGAPNAEALFAMAAVQAARGEKASAELALQRNLADRPDGAEARHLLAALHGEAIPTPVEGYSREAFDRIARQYDNRQIRLRAYRAPAELVNLIEEFEPERRAVARVLDAGCGTGLAMTALRDAYAVQSAAGIDLSPDMVEIARNKGLYDQLMVNDAAQGLAALEGSYDLIVAADLFPYLGELTAFMTAARTRLTAGGLLAYSIEASPDRPMALAATGRFVHTPAYIDEVARKAGLRPVASRAITLRRRFGRGIPGHVGLLQA